jgi:uncharacterized membrane protein
MLVPILALATLTPTLAAQTFNCRGEEPFWHVELTGSSAKLSQPGSAAQTFKGEMKNLSYLKPPWIVWRGTAGGLTEPLVLVMRQEQCHSTMADGPAMPYRAILSLRPGEAATGCCTTTAAASAWTDRLPDLLPAIRKCVIDSGVAVRSVTKAWPMNRGMVGVRLVDLKGGRSDCIADARACP